MAILGTVLLTAISAGASPAPAELPAGKQRHRAKDPRPDIVLIMTDQQTASAMSCAGNPFVNTPAMDALAADGVNFASAYCPFPVSGASRASIITGQIPYTVGVSANADTPGRDAMDAGIGHRMAKAGYDCLYAGKWHVPTVNLPEKGTGFRKICNMGDGALPEAVDKALDTRNAGKPLLLVASFLDPHEICEWGRWESLPYGPVKMDGTETLPPLPANAAADPGDAEILSLEKQACPRTHDTATYTDLDWQKYLYTYYRLVERVDRQVGELVKILKDRGLYDKALIVFCSDHGDGAAAHRWNQKWALWQESVNVPLVVKAPEGEGVSGKTNRTALCNIGLDLYATFCDYAGVRLDPETYFGKSLRPVIEGKTETLHENVYVETRFEGVPAFGWCVIGPRYKYILYQWGRNREAFFDLDSDPGETRNLIDDPAVAGELSNARRDLLEWAEKVGNPLCLRNIRKIVKYGE